VDPEASTTAPRIAAVDPDVLTTEPKMLALDPAPRITPELTSTLVVPLAVTVG